MLPPPGICLLLTIGGRPAWPSRYLQLLDHPLPWCAILRTTLGVWYAKSLSIDINIANICLLDPSLPHGAPYFEPPWSAEWAMHKLEGSTLPWHGTPNLNLTAFFNSQGITPPNWINATSYSYSWHIRVTADNDAGIYRLQRCELTKGKILESVSNYCNV